LPVVCLDARHVKAALSLQINKTDANDALGLAQIVRSGWYREVAVKSMDAHTLRLLLVARAQLVSQRQAVANTVRGLLKTFGLRVARCSKGLFASRVRKAADGNYTLLAIVEPLLTAWQAFREQVAVLDRQILARAKADKTAQRLMTVPGIGVVVALATVPSSTIPSGSGNPARSGLISASRPNASNPARRTGRATSPDAGIACCDPICSRRQPCCCAAIRATVR